MNTKQHSPAESRNDLPVDHIECLWKRTPSQVKYARKHRIQSIRDLPREQLHNATQVLIWRSLRQRRALYVKDEQHQLPRPTKPVLFMDFETLPNGLPTGNGFVAGRQVPFQWEVCIVGRGGRTHRHVGFLSPNGADPRRAFLRTLLDTVESVQGPIVVYSHFERTVLRALRDAVPGYRRRIDSVVERLFDLCAFVTSHAYHPAFRGSFGLKSVLPALVPRLAYDDLEIQGGLAAGEAFVRSLCRNCDAAERERLRQALVAYCRRDVLGMVELWKLLLERTQPD
jgi:predicted RecB family nuclease